MTEKTSQPGGIDLNPNLLDLQIERDGNGIPLPVVDQPIETMNIEGFIPVIINVVPVSLPMLLGLDTRSDDDNHNQLSFESELSTAEKRE